jgi:ATP-dependent RNA helicase DDX46/PRP5
MIDILVTSNGKITNLRRVTMVVIDEADRMFDMGFEPQVMRIMGQVRPDRQLVLFSATFPYSVETVARELLVDPVFIQVRQVAKLHCSLFCTCTLDMFEL